MNLIGIFQYEKSKNELISMEITSIKWSELAQNLQRTNET